jgi:DNA-binding GntR family transcriptional regulator
VLSIVESIIGPAEGRTRWPNPCNDLASCDGFREELNPSYGLAAERMPPMERQGLEAVHEELRLLSYAGNPDRFREVNERFHNAIYAGSQNGYIAEMTLATRVRVQPFRRAQFRNLGRLAKSHAEHDRVVVAIMRGDRVGAGTAMRAHIELVRGEYELYAVSV